MGITEFYTGIFSRISLVWVCALLLKIICRCT